ncbi:MAG TPA: FHA domain-containing protein [Pyrinomonadaceae bacterium]|nr:FHA domain-containing protein [Pyrinomonadaceae bacterium]
MQTSKFVIIREDLNVDPTTLVTDGLKIGRSPSCELVLNHPTVSRLHAGINETGGRFFIFNFSHSSGTAINGRVVAIESAEVLADGDLVQIGPFFLQLEREGDALVVRVTLEVAVRVGEAEGRVEIPNAEPQPTGAAAGQDDPELSDALNVFWEKRKREEGKMQRISPLRPRAPSRVLGKARFNWTPTRDLVRPWPFSIFIWATVIVAALAGLAAVAYSSAYTPAPISSPHARQALQTQPAIARQPNGSSCTTCHTLTGSMEANCASCHQAEGFTATVTDAHREAGVGCTSCHVEHQGTEFRPSVASLQTCFNCHNDANTKTFNGKRVGTPHGGTFGYPVVGGKWTWKGLEKDEWERKPAELREVRAQLDEASKRWPTGGDADAARRTAEFHALHLYRVKAVGGLRGNKEGEVSCGTCHQSFAPIDRETPRTTCGTCHNGDPGGKFERVLAADQPNCNSCHVQHVKGRRGWGASLLAAGASETPKTAQAPRFVSSTLN